MLTSYQYWEDQIISWKIQKIYTWSCNFLNGTVANTIYRLHFFGHPGGLNYIKPALVADVTYAGYYVANW